MEVYRISQEKYAGKIISSGSPNRWNLIGQKVIYTSQSRSLCSLEMVVHRSNIKPTDRYKMMIISISDTQILYEDIKQSKLPKRWQSMRVYSILQEMGSQWYKSRSSLILKVPSVVIPYENNYIINTEHPDFYENVRLVRTEDYFWDDRLL